MTTSFTCVGDCALKNEVYNNSRYILFNEMQISGGVFCSLACFGLPYSQYVQTMHAESQ